MNERAEHRFLDGLDGRRVRQVDGVSSSSSFAVLQRHAVDHARVGGDDVQVVLAAQALLDDLHVQQAQESAAEAESERGGVLGLVGERAVVEANRSMLLRSFS